MYRWMPADGAIARDRLRAGLEPGAEGDLAMQARHTAWWYESSARDTDEWTRVDHFEAGDPGQRAAHGWTSPLDFAERQLTARYEGEPPVEETVAVLERGPGPSSFHLQARGCGDLLRLRRLFDAADAGQAAEVTVRRGAGDDDGAVARTALSFSVANTQRRWSEIDLDVALPAPAAGGEIVQVTVDAQPENTAGRFSEARWELWCYASTLLFGDGFEAGDVSSWSATAGVTASTQQRP